VSANVSGAVSTARSCSGERLTTSITATGRPASTASCSIARAASSGRWWNALIMVRTPGRPGGTRVASTGASDQVTRPPEASATARSASRLGWRSVRCTRSVGDAATTAAIGPPPPEPRSSTDGSSVVATKASRRRATTPACPDSRSASARNEVPASRQSAGNHGRSSSSTHCRRRSPSHGGYSSTVTFTGPTDRASPAPAPSRSAAAGRHTPCARPPRRRRTTGTATPGPSRATSRRPPRG
jgi:hypothetical protein